MNTLIDAIERAVSTAIATFAGSVAVTSGVWTAHNAEAAGIGAGLAALYSVSKTLTVWQNAGAKDTTTPKA